MSDTRRAPKPKQPKDRSANPSGGADAGDEATDRVSTRRGLIEQEIYSQAIRLFAERGFAGTNFQDIADAVGLTRPALYHYVKSKEDLLSRVVAETTQDAATSISQIVARDDLDAEQKLFEIVRTNVIRQGQHSTRLQLLVRSEASLPEPIASMHQESRRLVLRLVISVVEDGMAAGIFRPVNARVAALGVLGMSNWVSWWYRADRGEDLAVISEELADLAVAGLAARDGQRAAVDSPAAVVKILRADLLRLEEMLKD